MGGGGKRVRTESIATNRGHTKQRKTSNRRSWQCRGCVTPGGQIQPIIERRTSSTTSGACDRRLPRTQVEHAVRRASRSARSAARSEKKSLENRFDEPLSHFANRGVLVHTSVRVCGRTPGLLRLEESQRSLFTSESDGNDVREMLRVASADVAGYAKRGGMRGGSPFLSNNAAYSSSKKNFKRNRTCWALRCAECQYDGRAPRPFRFFVTRLRHTNQDFRTFPESRLNAFASQIHFCQLSPT